MMRSSSFPNFGDIQGMATWTRCGAMHYIQHVS